MSYDDAVESCGSTVFWEALTATISSTMANAQEELV